MQPGATWCNLVQPGGRCCRLQVAAAPPGALGLARPCLAGWQQDLHITTLCTDATVLRWRHTLKLSLFERLGQELMIRQRKLGLCGGLRIVLDWEWLNSSRDGSNWIYGGQELCNNYKLHLVFALQDNLLRLWRLYIYEPGPEKELLFCGCDGCEYYFKLVLGRILQIKASKLSFYTFQDQLVQPGFNQNNQLS